MRSVLLSFFLILASLTAGAGEVRTITYNGVSREYLVYVPSSYSGVPLPLVVALHGSGGNGSNMEGKTGFSVVAERGFVAAYPSALDGSWDKVADVGFLQAVVADVEAQVAIDPGRLYFVGHSQGGGMASRMACAWSRVSALADVSHALSASDEAYCASAPPRPVVVLHGTVGPGSSFADARDTAQFWAAKYGSVSYATASVDLLLGSGAAQVGTAYSASVPVVLYKLTGGGHSFPSTTFIQSDTVVRIGEVDTNPGAEVIWSFFGGL